MTLLLARIDDRLIHQQVVDGCCQDSSVARLILAHDTVAADEAAKSVFAAAAPKAIPTEILSVADAARRLGQLERGGGLESTILVTGTPQDMLRVVEAGCPISSVTVGGMHKNANRPTRLWDGFFMGADERDTLLQLQDRGIHVVFQTVPGAAGRALRELVGPGGPT